MTPIPSLEEAVADALKRNAIPHSAAGPVREGFARCQVLAVFQAIHDEGYVVVPREPTGAMHNGARDWSDRHYGKPVGIDGSDGCYRAMIQAHLDTVGSGSPLRPEEGRPPFAELDPTCGN